MLSPSINEACKRVPELLRRNRSRQTKNGWWSWGRSALTILLAFAMPAFLYSSHQAFAEQTPTAATTTQSKLPNIVLFLVDDLGYGDLSSYGATDLHTPAIDTLLNEGLRFTNFHANCPVCSPTRAALLTGCYPDRVGVPGVIRTEPDANFGYLSPQAELLPNRLKASGYHTAIIGKWHLGLSSPNIPTERGFDLFRGFLGDMMDDYYTHLREGQNFLRDGLKPVQSPLHATDLFTNWACDYVRDRARHSQPYFLYLAYNAPHTPIQPPADWLAKVRQREPQLSDKRAKIVALIEHLDEGIGRVLQTLDETDQRDRTVVIFSSDNGGDLAAGASCGPLKAGKGTMYQGGLKVPTGVRWPGTIAQGGVE